MSLKRKIASVARKGVASTVPVQLLVGTVTSAPPNLTVRLKNNRKLDIPKELLLVAEHLTRHTRSIRVNGGTTNTHEFMDELRVGDKVMVESVQGGQAFFIVDRVKKY